MKIAYCTIASANYLPRVRVLEESLATHRPGASLHVLLCERPEVCRALSEETGRPFTSPADVCTDWLQMAFYYNVTEYNTALKPFFLEHLLDAGYDAVFYFDPDIEIFGSLEQMEALAATHDLILTPHICKPISIDGLKPGVAEIIRVGQFNLGYIGLSDSTETRNALRWWQGVCLEHCLFDVRNGYFVDQFWADILPSFIQKFYCLRDPAYNMAYWNVFQRSLALESGHWMTDSGELKFFHFSGLPKDNLARVSVHQNRVSASPGSPLYELLVSYTNKIANNVYSRFAQHPYSFGQYATGKVITPVERRLFLTLSRTKRLEFGDPFRNRDTIQALTIQAFTREREPARAKFNVYKQYLAAVRSQGFFIANLLALRFLAWKVAHRIDRLIEGKAAIQNKAAR